MDHYIRQVLGKDLFSEGSSALRESDKLGKWRCFSHAPTPMREVSEGTGFLT